MDSNKFHKSQDNPSSYRIIRWSRETMGDIIFMIIMAAAVGMLCGTAAFALKWMLAKVSGIFTPHIKDDGINWWLGIVPVAGILITGIITRHILRYSPSHGVARLINSLRHKDYRLRRSLTFSPMLTSVITLGMGGTSGTEGPIAYTGAAIGSNVGRLARLPSDMLHTLIACGTGAGIAGIFIAPVGGILFVLEVVRMKLDTNAIMAVVTACITSWLTASAFNGFAPDIAFSSQVEIASVNYIHVMLLGIFCGLYSMYYSIVMERMDTFFRQLSNPLWSNILGGATIGLCLILFPSMYCVGYPVIGQIINGHTEAIAAGSALTGSMPTAALLFVAAICILVLKCWGVAATNSSGGVGGDFAPTLFAGSIAGFVFALLCNSVAGTELPLPLFAFLGMAGVMSGVIEAPAMTIFITLEMTCGYEFAIPVAITALISYITERAGKAAVKNRERMILHSRLFSRL